MTRPIHSVKHIRSLYQKIQTLVFICLCITIIAVVLSAVSSFQIDSLSHRIKTENAREISAKEADLSKKLASIDKELSALKEKLKNSEKAIKTLHSKNDSLKKELTAALESSRPQAPVENSGNNKNDVETQPTQNTDSGTETTATPDIPDIKESDQPPSSATGAAPDAISEDSPQPTSQAEDSQEEKTPSEEAPSSMDSTSEPEPADPEPADIDTTIPPENAPDPGQTRQ